MTKPMRKAVRLANLDQLTKTIIAKLEKSGIDGLTIQEINEGLIFSKDTVRSRLFMLKAEGRVHRVQHIHPSRNNVCYTWHLVGASASVEQGGMRQPTVREYPVVGFCDPLVAALFGRPQKEVA